MNDRLGNAVFVVPSIVEGPTVKIPTFKDKFNCRFLDFARNDIKREPKTKKPPKVKIPWGDCTLFTSSPPSVHEKVWYI